MVKITIEKNTVPVTIGALDFEYTVTDKNVLSFEKIATESEKTLVQVLHDFQEDKIDEPEMVKKANAELSVLFDLLLGEGAYKKIYEQTPSVLTNAEIFMELIVGIREESDKLEKQKNKKRKAKMDEYKNRKK